MKKIKVLFLEDVGERAGGSNSLLQLFSYIHKNVDIHVFSPKGYFTNESKKYSKNIFYSNIIRYESILLFNKRLPNLYHIFLRLLDSVRLFRYVKKNNIDIVHSNDLDGHIIAWFLNHIFNITSVWHIRIMTWPKILYKLKRVSKIIFVSKAVSNFSLNGSSNENTTVIYNGIDINSFRKNLLIQNNNEIKNKYNIGDDQFVIGYVGRIKHQKRQMILVKAVHLLIKKGYNIKLILVGDDSVTKESISGNPDQYFNEIKKMIVKYNLEKNVVLTGHQSNVTQFYNIFNCFAFPAINDSNPRVILEAMTAQIPIIANDTGGVVDMLENGKYGLIAKVDNVKDLSNKIECLIKKDIIIDTRKTYKKLINDYTLDIHSQNILNLYNELIKK
tara:strand:- start:1171 stop:2334 length:1164 start_codon:yes stop_codon:yes gene_type:complete